MEKRIATLKRTTKETDVEISLDIDGAGEANVGSGIGFFDHMLILFAKHGLFSLSVKAQGDLVIDGHHTVEDIGIVLGQALAKATGDKAGIRRYGHVYVPMDEALVLVVVDFSGRPFLAFDAELGQGRIGEFDVELTEEFLRAVAKTRRQQRNGFEQVGFSRAVGADQHDRSRRERQRRRAIIAEIRQRQPLDPEAGRRCGIGVGVEDRDHTRIGIST